MASAYEPYELSLRNDHSSRHNPEFDQKKIHLNQEQVDKTKLPPHHQILINHTQPPFHFYLIRNHN